jgi:hypothetical protein
MKQVRLDRSFVAEKQQTCTIPSFPRPCKIMIIFAILQLGARPFCLCVFHARAFQPSLWWITDLPRFSLPQKIFVFKGLS